MASASLARASNARSSSSGTLPQSPEPDTTAAAVTETPKSATCEAMNSRRAITHSLSTDFPCSLRHFRPRRLYAAVLPPATSTLRIPAFRRLAASYGLNELGDNFAMVALAILVFDGTGSALATAALFVAGKFVPAFGAPVLTARVDRGAAQIVLPTIYLVESVAFMALAVIAATSFSLPLVLALAFVDGTLALTARGLSRAAVASVLDPHDALRSGNAVLNVLFAVSGALGPALAGVVVATTSTATALAIDAGSFAAVALLLATASGLPSATAERAEPWFARFRAGLGYVIQRPVLRALVTAEALAFVFFFLVIPIEVIYSKKTLDAGDLGFGALLGSWGIGMIVGSAAFARFRNSATVVLVGTSTALVGLGYLGLAIAPDIVLACVASAVGGIGNGIQWIAVMTAVQEAVEHRFQARVVGLLESVGAAAPGLGYLLGGVLTSIWSPRIAYLVAGAGVIVVAIAMTRQLASA